MTVTPWRLVGAWLVLVAVGSALESVLLGVGTAVIGSFPSIPVAVWALALWDGLMAPGLAVTVVLLAKPASAGIGASSGRKVFITAASALSALIACVSVLVCVLIGNLASAHVVDSGRPVSVWLEPGVYRINQDPASDGDLSFFSVTGRNGPVEVTSDFSPLELGDVGSLFLGADRNNYSFFPAGHFRITSPGEYRLVNDNEGIYPAVLVTVPYSGVAKRTLPWIVGNQAAFAVMLLCLAHARYGFKRLDRPKLPTGRDFWESWD